RVRDTFVLETPGGEELFTIQEKKLSVRDKMEIERGAQTVATVKKALVSPLRDRFTIAVEAGEDMEAKGNIVDHEYKIERDGDKTSSLRPTDPKTMDPSSPARSRRKGSRPSGVCITTNCVTSRDVRLRDRPFA